MTSARSEFAARRRESVCTEIYPIGSGTEAICHVKMLGDYALPGQVIVGSDSHTPHSGAIGCMAFGVGTSAIVNSWATRGTYSLARARIRCGSEVDGELARRTT